jgi:hypothetical protein
MESRLGEGVDILFEKLSDAMERVDIVCGGDFCQSCELRRRTRLAIFVPSTCSSSPDPTSSTSTKRKDSSCT